MAKAVKLRNNLYLDSSSIVHDNKKLGDILYPIGSIYLSVNNINPGSLFGGTWEQIKDTFLLACGDTYGNGTTGGEAEHTLTTSEMPSHNHSMASGGEHKHNIRYKAVGRQDGGYWTPIGSTAIETTTTAFTISSGSHSHTINNTGSGNSHNNMPPYLAVYVWKRIA